MTYIPTQTSEYDMNAACIDPKKGNGLTEWSSRAKIEKNIQDRFNLGPDCCPSESEVTMANEHMMGVSQMEEY